jgi:hypothetical protein
MKTLFLHLQPKPFNVVLILVLFFCFDMTSFAQPHLVPGSFEAEHFIDMSGIVVDPATDVVDPGDCIAWIEEGDWVEYGISVASSADYFFTIRGTSPNIDSYIIVFVDDAEEIIVPVLNTGSWEYYATFSSPEYLHLAQGEHTLKLSFFNGSPYIANINYITISQDYWIHQEAEVCLNSSGIDVEASTDTAYPGQNIGWIEAGDWIEYSIDPFKTGNHYIMFRGASPNSDSYIKIFSEDNELEEVPVYNTASWANYDLFASRPFFLTEDEQTLKFQFFNGSPYVVNLNFFELIYEITDNPVNSIDLSTSENLQIYPNPTDGILYIDMPGAVNEYSAEVFDMLGKSLYRKGNLSGGTIDISQLPAGVYYLKIESDNQHVTRKVLKR